MSFFRKVFASVGIGSAKVDTIIETEDIYAGCEVKGRVDLL